MKIGSISGEGGYWFLTPCYRTRQASLHFKLWAQLKEIAPTISTPWCVVGDFNVVLYK